MDPDHGIVYSGQYDSKNIRGSEDVRSWDIQHVLRRFWKSGGNVVDVGCGTCSKTAWMCAESAEFIGIDPSPIMREEATKRLSETGKMFKLISGRSDNVSLDDAYADHLVSLLAPYNIEEFARIIKEGGTCILEVIGELDKRALKAYFGDDDKGQRGQMMQFMYPSMGESLKEAVNKYFYVILFAEGMWETRYTRSQLEELLTNTNTIRAFSKNDDREKLDAFEEEHSENGFISLTDHRYLIIGRRMQKNP